MEAIVPYKEPTREQVDLIKRTVAKGATDDELALFLYQSKRTGLDPLLRQIHAVKRWSEDVGRMVMAIQTGIDGYRLIADRTGRYAPGKATIFEHDDDGKLVSATAYVKKLVAGEWHEVAATAYFDEYAQHKKDGNLNRFWKTMRHNQLAKCAEALALRRAFPAELSGLYTNEEMQQADNETALPTTGEVIERDDGTKVECDPPPPKVSPVKVIERINAIKDIESLTEAETWWNDDSAKPNKDDYSEEQQKMIEFSFNKKHKELTGIVQTPERKTGEGEEQPTADKTTSAQVRLIYHLGKELIGDKPAVKKWIMDNFGFATAGGMPPEVMQDAINRLRGMSKQPSEPQEPESEPTEPDDLGLGEVLKGDDIDLKLMREWRLAVHSASTKAELDKLESDFYGDKLIHEHLNENQQALFAQWVDTKRETLKTQGVKNG